MIIQKVFKINGMHCTSCALKIDYALEDLQGVIESKTSYNKLQTEVKFDDSKIQEKQIMGLIKKTGYSVN